jgi:pimeloyl-ACP methyl ester carboxylesterase
MPNYALQFAAASNSSALQNATQPGPADGQPIMLIHGFGASVGHWRNNVPAMVERGYRTYAIDLLGFGGSDKPKEVALQLGIPYTLHTLLCLCMCSNTCGSTVYTSHCNELLSNSVLLFTKLFVAHKAGDVQSRVMA